MKKKDIKFIGKFKRIIPEVGEEIVECIQGEDSIKKTFSDIATHIVETIQTEDIEKKHKRKLRRLYNVGELDTLKKIIAVKQTESIDKKFSTNPNEWLAFDYVNYCWRIRAFIPDMNIKKPIYINLGSGINIEHYTDECFLIKFQGGQLIYDNAEKKITDYQLV